jgi:hypothetical protein
MDAIQAKRLLALHSFNHPCASSTPKAVRGFLGSLRPYRGSLNPENYDDVIAALRALAPELRDPSVDTDMVSNLWSICHLGRTWGLQPHGINNKLLSKEDAVTLEEWIDTISYVTMMLLEGGDIDEALSDCGAPTWRNA